MKHSGPAPDIDAKLSIASHDVMLWARLRTADPDALTELFDQHSGAVYNFAFRRTASWSDAKDVTQSTFLAVWRRAAVGSLPSLEHPSALPWLLGVADRESRGVYRSLVRRGRLQQRLESIGPLEQHMADHAELVVQQLDDARQMTQVRDAVRVLPTHQRVVVELVIWSGLSVAETASALAISEGTVKSRLSRAKRGLGAQLGAQLRSDPTTPTNSED